MLNLIKQFIDDLLAKDNLHTYDEFQKEIYDQAAERLFRNKNTPLHVKKLARAKLPRLLDISSNAPEHLIFETIKQKITNQKIPDNEGIEKLISETIAHYIAIDKLIKNDVPNLDKPNQEDLKEILEYEQLYDLKIDIMIEKEIENILQKTNEIITNIINTNQNSGKEEPIIPQELLDLLNNVRNNITKENKEKWVMLEIIMEKISHLQKLRNIKQIRKHPGRPKKVEKNNTESNQSKLEEYFN